MPKNSRIDQLFILIFAATCCFAGIGMLVSGATEGGEIAVRVCSWVLAIGGGLWALDTLVKLSDRE